MTIYIEPEYVTRIEDENKKLKNRSLYLSRTTTELKNELFREALIKDETEEYINKLKHELFNLYLKHYN